MTHQHNKGFGAAHGKVILLGEHAVVHGTNAIATSLDATLEVQASFTSSTQPLKVAIKNWGHKVKIGTDTRESQALRALCATLGVSPRGIKCEVDTQIPFQSGLGASAALAAALARALCSLLEIEADDQLLFDAVQASERVFHANPSGIDAALALFGGSLIYNKEDGPRAIEFDPLPLTIVHSGTEGATLETVALVATKLREAPNEGHRRILQIGELVDQALAALQNNDLNTIGTLMNLNQEHLRWFGVSTKAIDNICDFALNAGARGVKLSGGGGGGAVIILEANYDGSIAKKIEQNKLGTIIP